MEESKYYTPTIEEFYVGFEYERMNGDKWEESEIIPTDCFGTLARGYENEFEEIYTGIRDVRVKYLDKKDIESLGFSDYTPPYEYAHTWKLNSYTLKCWFNNEIPHLRIQQHIVTVFEGNIKNKSELKKLLNQLKIS